MASSLADRIEPLRKQTLQDTIYERVSRLILEGGLAPGQSLTVASLAEAFGVSPMPVREALSRLTAAGALTVVSGRTVGVPKMAKARLRDLRDVRLEVETTAARWAVNRGSGTSLDGLGRVFTRLEVAEAAGDAVAYIAANHDFHFAIYEMSESPTLLSIISNLWLQITPCFHLLRESGNFHMSNHQHLRMFKGMQVRDPVAVCEALKADITGAYEVLAGTI